MPKSGTPIERNLLICTLKLTKEGPIRKELIAKEARIPQQDANRMLKKFSEMGLIQLRRETVEVSSSQRVKVAIQAIRLGADIERACRALGWMEFENIAAMAFETNGFSVKRRFRFKWAGRRWEIDVLGCREPLVVCADCKHWLRGWRRSAIAKAVESQVRRTQTLADALPLLREKIDLTNWKNAIFIPAVLSLVQGPFKFYNDVPIVPILQLQNFLSELPAHVTSLAHFSVHF